MYFDTTIFGKKIHSGSPELTGAWHLINSVWSERNMSWLNNYTAIFSKLLGQKYMQPALHWKGGFPKQNELWMPPTWGHLGPI